MPPVAGGCQLRKEYKLQIQVSSDKNIAVDAEFTLFVRGEVNRALKRFTDKITRVEVHLSDVNSSRVGKRDKRCMVEARPAGHRPVVATMASANLDSAVRGSLRKLRMVLVTIFGRIGNTPNVSRPTESSSGVPLASSKTARSKTRASHPSETGMTAKRNLAAAADPKPPRQSAGKTLSATVTATEPSVDIGRSPKKKGIYQARRKSWPGA